MSGADILNSPVRVNERSRTVYYFDGYVCCDIISGTEEQQRAVLALVAQAQNLARIARDASHGGCEEMPGPCGECLACNATKALRDAGVMSDPPSTVGP